MKRLDKLFSKIDINNFAVTKKQRDLIITVWADHFNKVIPKGICNGRFNSIIRQTYFEWKMISENKPTLKEKLDKVEAKKPIKKTRKRKAKK